MESNGGERDHLQTTEQSKEEIIHQQANQMLSFGMMQSSSLTSSPIPGIFNIGKDGGGGAYDLGELDQALFLFLDGQQDHPPHQDQRQDSEMRPPTLDIFPSQPMHEDSSPEPSKVSAGLGSPSTSGYNKSSEPAMDHLSNPRNNAASPPEQAKAVKRDGNRRGPAPGSEHDGPKTTDPKTLRRLAQNREAARKSRLRKKAYVQQLETSRMRLTQLEDELQRARSQGFYLGGPALLGGDRTLPVPMSGVNSDAALFDMEYARWLEEHHRIVSDLRNAVADHLPENDLGMLVESCLGHYDQMMSLKAMIAKSDAFHLISGMWKTPAERCFMWIGGFRPSDIIKIIVREVEPLSEPQLMGICGLQQSTHEAEEALSQGLESLSQSLSQAVVSNSLVLPPNMNSYMSQMALAIGKLSTLEAFIRQADNLRLQTLHRLHQILTTRQASRFLLAMAEYFHRLRALSSLWLSRPRQD